jgi:hypothetical protein
MEILAGAYQIVVLDNTGMDFTVRFMYRVMLDTAGMD